MSSVAELRALRESEERLIDELRSRLIAADFEVTCDEDSPESFGNIAIGLERPPLQVGLVRDRDQWWIDVAGPDGDLVDIGRWVDVVRGTEYSLGGILIVEQIQLLEELLPEFDRLARAPDFATTAQRMRDLGRKRADVLFGPRRDRPSG